jgi:DNA polymerase alpha-associated DNA helicase A
MLSQIDKGQSRSNRGEAAILQAHVSSLVKAGLKAKDIAVITPYNAQVHVSLSILQIPFG